MNRYSGRLKSLSGHTVPIALSEEGRTAEKSRRRLTRTLTFWLRPAFALGCFARFQRIAGFDRSMALASSSLTALVPVAIIGGTVLSSLTSSDAADRIISRYGLSGAGADAVKALFSPAQSGNTSVGVFGVLFLVISALSFTRALQRLFEQAWELKPLSVRNTRNGLWWLLSGGVFALATGWLYAALGETRRGLLATICETPLSAVFLIWSGYLLSARRIGWQDLIPFGVMAAVATAVYSWGTALYLPHVFNTSAERYGVVGAVFALISALFGVMLIVVGSAALGREVADELSRIAQGQRTPDDEVRRQWDSVVEQTSSRWRKVRRQVSLHRPDEPPEEPSEERD
ncbi:YihY/virulence factor BrkB family protein [Streptomyces collinus]|uniref:YihY/virulence factor BrkB family protein n=1 Tax=Streptomyces collinus TaxID=42684 RepID=UPI002941C749|nr:YhjD/YihY/BrkB family envelope integrity protein [Streptomyces collinus]